MCVRASVWSEVGEEVVKRRQMGGGSVVGWRAWGFGGWGGGEDRVVG